MHIIYRYCHPWQDAEKYFQEVSSMICLIDICSISGFPLVVTALQSAQASTTASCCLALIGFDGILGFIMISWMKHMNGTYIHSIYIYMYTCMYSIIYGRVWKWVIPIKCFFSNQGCQPPNSLSTVCSNAKSIFDVLIVWNVPFIHSLLRSIL